MAAVIKVVAVTAVAVAAIVAKVARAARGGSSRGESARSGSQSDDLKSREYRDEQGNVHHHTKEYMERQKGEKNG